MLIDGRGRVVGPAQAVQKNPEQAANAERKYREMRESKARKQAEQGEGVTAEPDAEQSAEPVVDTAEPVAEVIELDLADFEGQRLPWESDGDMPIGEPTTPAEAEAWARAHGGGYDENGMSFKMAARKAQDQREAEASERGDVEHVSPKMAYAGDMASDADFEAARLAHEQAEAHLRALQTEQAGMFGRTHEAIASGDFDTLKALRMRQAELPHELDAARMGAIDARIAYLKPRAARARVEKQQARAADRENNAEYLEWQRKRAESQGSVYAAEMASDDAVQALGAAMRERDALIEELVRQRAPQSHRAPMGVQQGGLDSSGLTPMPQPGS